ncbi:lipoprotein [Lysobacter enzymogenes]|uniref:Lipoprotein n=1 Tax=Lysobacter enzymogenes TaxID=69 RepID=A0A0S2DI86_LYSEN|nr:lipoprotein [Lysobacter enzymogenes]
MQCLCNKGLRPLAPPLSAGLSTGCVDNIEPRGEARRA